jgi:hypothetical protein
MCVGVAWWSRGRNFVRKNKRKVASIGGNCEVKELKIHLEDLLKVHSEDVHDYRISASSVLRYLWLLGLTFELGPPESYPNNQKKGIQKHAPSFYFTLPSLPFYIQDNVFTSCPTAIRRASEAQCQSLSHCIRTEDSDHGCRFITRRSGERAYGMDIEAINVSACTDAIESRKMTSTLKSGSPTRASRHTSSIHHPTPSMSPKRN